MKKNCKKKNKECNSKEKKFFDSLENTLNDYDFSGIEGGNFRESLSFLKRAKKSKDINFSKLEGSFKEVFSDTIKIVGRKKQIKHIAIAGNRDVIIEGKKDPDFSKIKSKGFKRALSDAKKITSNQSPENIPITNIEASVENKQAVISEIGSKANIEKLTNFIGVQEQEHANIIGGEKPLQRIFIPNDRELIVQGVDKFIMNPEPQEESIRNIGYYKGEKLKQLVLTFNNTSQNDFVCEVFNPSMPLDYLYSTSLNLNDKISIGGGNVAYSNVLFNLLANPALIVNAKFTFAVSASSTKTMQDQINIPLLFMNQNIQGMERIAPLNIALQYDTMQYAKDIVFFDIMGTLNRPFIPDGMDFFQYTVFAGMTVTMAFFLKQHSIKRFFFPNETKPSKALL